MKKFLTPVVAAFAVLAATTMAFAADATGNITKIDAAAKSVTLADGKVYVFPATVDITKLKVGDKVKVTFTTSTDGKTNNATAVANAT
jgi:Cu/Ag efflux protein CusF